VKFALAQVELKQGKNEAARQHLAALEKDAKAKGFFLIAGKASAAAGAGK
jgi:hypothetical protein